MEVLGGVGVFLWARYLRTQNPPVLGVERETFIDNLLV